jgi:ATP diphosphatase
MPALTRAIKLQAKAAKVGFDWPSIAPVLDKLREELAELNDEIASANAAGADSSGVRQRIEDEYGDLLFVMANLARHLDIDPEAALRKTNQKFTRRFRGVEALLAARGKTPAQSNLAEMDAFWDEVKHAERK